MNRSYLKSLLIPVGTLILFVLVGLVRGSVQDILLLVLVLLVHETGHLLAMKLSGFKDVRMLFIPMLGALVTGTPQNVSPWRKALISFMGPVPGLLIGAGCLAAGIVLDAPLLRQYALLSVLLNGFNLLPVMPLDGGQILNGIFLGRSLILQAAFKIAGIAALLLMSLVFENRFLVIVAIPLGLSVRTTWRLARVVRAVETQGVAGDSLDEGLLRMYVLQVYPGIGERESYSLAFQMRDYFSQQVAGAGVRIAAGVVYLCAVLLTVVLGFALALLVQYSKEIVAAENGRREFVRHFGDVETVRADLGDGDYFDGSVVIKSTAGQLQARGQCRNGMREGEWFLRNEQTGGRELSVLYDKGRVVELKYAGVDGASPIPRHVLEDQNPAQLGVLENNKPEHPGDYFSFR